MAAVEAQSRFDEPALNLTDDKDDEVFFSVRGTEEEIKFDSIIEALQNILIDEDFVELQNSFGNNNCKYFEDSEENKFIYTSLFEQYTNVIENYLERRLEEEIKGFSMTEFYKTLQDHRDEIPMDIFDLLTSCGEFQEFKSFMLSFKQQNKRIEVNGGSVLHQQTS